MTATYNWYFIAILPPESVSKEITGFKQDFALRFKSSKSLRVMPHITLKNPFRLKAEMHSLLLDWFRYLLVSVSAFDVELQNFGSFPNPSTPVVFIQPVPSAALMQLQKDIIHSFRNSFPSSGIHSSELTFKPHVTIAYRDLLPEQYQLAWKEYVAKKYYAVFRVEQICLLQHDGTKWKVMTSQRI